MSEVLSRDKPRDDVPDIKPIPPPAFKGCGAHPLSDMHRHLIAAAADRLKQHTGAVIDLNSISTTDDAMRAFDAHEGLVKGRVG